MESYLSSPPLSLSAHKRFQLLLFLFLQKKTKKTLLAYRYTARNNQIATFGYVSGTNQITALRYACANESVRVSSFMPITDVIKLGYRNVLRRNQLYIDTHKERH